MTACEVFIIPLKKPVVPNVVPSPGWERARVRGMKRIFS